ncbi:capsular polysaccharide synthesis protein [Pacificoceanicola onchidii]|uniref:capsular polysaccharide synthesis protein n=1 Tax=Pacificoceanicola onchidii TaxID=2562685 RepID=UPI0010A68332|nr:capsular polysaccharide synthesis protein [Pacificoceanicola onchidii]
MPSRIIARGVMPLYMLACGFLHRRHHQKPPFDMGQFTRDYARLPAPKPLPEALTRRIFIYWKQGFENAPPIVQAIRARWQSLNPGWEVVEITEQSEGDWVDMSDIHPDLPIATRSDVLRLRLIERHGGIWADATLLPMRPLEDWLGALMDEGFFAFRQDIPYRRVSSWFLAGVPGAAIAARWQDWFGSYIAHRPHPIAYFAVHFSFLAAMWGGSAAAKAWRRVPVLSADGPHHLKWLLHGADDPAKRPSPEELAAVPVFKLAWKNEAESVEGVTAKLAEFGIADPWG